ncbi:alpha/beta fold hydrolase [Sanyastnella coralliicola]|uniref:alpha/beta fold hydrolase n=1 Tax=Sanyastnella coralliicola TaxID=3069118 RepID=UPI0027B9CE5C|nr:alpha/beta hydrolase [Longitalea sp. SCSIO 12813]
MSEEASLNVDVVGHGAPTLLIHGFLEKGSMWDFLLERFPDRQYIVPDLPGHGSSDMPEDFNSMGSLADVCLDILDALEVVKADIIGHSLGGYVACELAHRAPERVGSLMMYHSTSCEDAEVKKALRDRAMEMVKTHKTHYTRSMIGGLFPENKKASYEALVMQLSEEANEMSSEVIARHLKIMRDRNDHQETLNTASFPVGYLLGNADPRLPMDSMDQEKTRVNPSFWTVMDQTGHMSQFEEPNMATQHMIQWFKSIGGL